MSKIEEAIEDIMDRHLSGMDFSDMITTEVGQCWDMDELDRIDDIADAVESLENNLDTSTLNSLREDIDRLKIDVENCQRSEQYLQCAWKTLSDNLKDDLEALRNEKSFFQKLIQKLMFWRS
tara:strand:- start:1 stop:366 length:366 start_codon:yes stop_codon:yes gene_type:complete